MQPNARKYFSGLFLPFPPGNHVPLPSAGGRLPPFPDAMPRCLPPPLFALCPWFEAGVFRPYLVFRLRCICLSSGSLSLRGFLTVARGRSPLNAPSMGNGGLLFPISLLKVAILSVFLLRIACVFSPCLGTKQMK